MGTFISESDLDPFMDVDLAKAQAMIEDAEADAILAAPCLANLHTPPDAESEAETALRLGKIAGVKSILRGAILRWHEAGTGALQAQTVGPFGSTFDNRQARRGMFWPSEIERLQKVCSGTAGKGAYAVDMLGSDSIHQPWCSLNFGALYCSCGAELAGFPIYEL